MVHPWSETRHGSGKDVKEGYVTPERARKVYGVEFDPNGSVDLEAKAKLRAHLDESA